MSCLPGKSNRMTSGRRALGALLEACSSSEDEATGIMFQMVDHVYQILETAKMSVKETLIIAIGSCGE